MSPHLYDIAAKIALAALLGGAVGAEREWSGKVAGLRTHMLIAVGSALLTDVSIAIGPAFASASQAWDPARLAAQIVSGIGFLGAGTIIQARGTVHGLTTAAGLWVSAALGIAVGARFFAEAALTTVMLLVVLALLPIVERRLLSPRRQELLVGIEGKDRSLAALADFLAAEGVELQGIRVLSVGGHRTAQVTFRGSRPEQGRLAAALEREGWLVEPDRA